jgi:hypothetical protein
VVVVALGGQGGPWVADGRRQAGDLGLDLGQQLREPGGVGKGVGRHRRQQHRHVRVSTGRAR